MSRRRFDYPFGAVLPVIVGILTAWSVAPTSRAAEPRFVGIVALIVEDDVARDLELSDSQREALQKLIEARESDALELALQLEGLSAPEREKKLAPFRRESEERGLAILSPQQQAKLQQIRIRKQGLASLMEPPLAEELQLTDDQRAQITQLVRQRAERLAAAEQPPHVIHAEVERSLAGLLTDQQRAAWQSLAFGPLAVGQEIAEGGPPAPPEPPAPVEGDPQTAETKAAPEPEGSQPAAVEAVASEPAESESPPPLAPEGPPVEPPPPPAMEPFEGEPAEPPVMTDREVIEFLESEPGVAAEPGPPDRETYEEMPADEDVRLRFNFRFHPWEDVLEWFAERAGLSLNYETLPQGTCNYIDNREYTPAEAIDVINSLLLIKGYTLVRHDRMLVLINLDDGIPPNLVTTVDMEDLDQRGEYELVSVLFELEKLTAEEAQAEIEKLIGPQGSVVVLQKAQQILVTETAGRLRTIQKVLQRIEDPEGASERMQTFELQFAMAEEVLTVLRQLMGIPAEENASPDGSIRFAVDSMGMRLIAVGKPSRLEQVSKILEALEAPGTGGLEGAGPEASLQIEVYSVAPADPDSVLKVMQTLLAGQAGARLSSDPKTGNLIALARPQDHATIRATLEQLKNDAVQVEVIQLRALDPQVAVVAITSMFGADKEGSTLKVDADPTSRRLLIRGTQTEVEQIRLWLEKMGETETAAAAALTSNVRILPLSGRAAESALERLQAIWPTMRANRIRVVTPSAVIPTLRAGQPAEASPADEAPLDGLFVPQPNIRPLTPARPPSQPPPWPLDTAPAPKSPSANPPEAKSQSAGSPRPRAVLVSETRQSEPDSSGSEPEQPAAEAAPQPAGEPAAIIVAPGPGGIMIASKDIEALNDFEDLLTALAGDTMAGGMDVTVFYLIHAKATTTAEILDEILGGGTVASTGGSRGGSLIGDLAGAAFGSAGEVMSSLIGLAGSEGTITPSGSIRITADDRLNALIVQANSADLALIEQLLKILDQSGSPEDVLVQAKPRMIPVFNTSAEEIAEVVREVYQDRMVSGARGGGRPPSPQEIIEAIRGGRGRGGSSRRTSEDVQRMSIGVDTRTNSLVVSAPEALFQEVKQLVEDLDAAAIESTQYSVVTVPLKRTNTDAVQKALSALVGESVSFGGASGARRSSQPDSGPRPPFGGSDMDAMRRRMEFFRTLQGGGGPPGGFFGGRGGGPGSGFRPPGSSGGPSGGPRPSSSGGPRSSRGGSRR